MHVTTLEVSYKCHGIANAASCTHSPLMNIVRIAGWLASQTKPIGFYAVFSFFFSLESQRYCIL